MSIYSSAFFDNQRAGSFQSAKVILPYLIDVFQPRSLLDIGCGQGMWLKVARDLGIPDLIGVDGAWAQPALAIPAQFFRASELGAPFELGRKFDLVISMEVGEHISASHARTFVGNLVRHSDAVVFSAAIPFQGGIHHVNERWPAYWASIFAGHNYRCFDFIRWRLWNDDRIATWYRQNVLTFVNIHNSKLVARLDNEMHQLMPEPHAVVHPQMWTAMMNSKSLRYQRLFTPALRRIRGLVGAATAASSVKTRYERQEN